VVTCPNIEPESVGVAFIALAKPNKMPTAKMPAMLKFIAKEMAGSDVVESYDDEYQLENLEIGLNDY
jgi:hypothetical protein